jgi:nitronate monooxygenase
MKTGLSDLLKIDFPVIMAPMFLVTNVKMMIAAGESGITGCIPALNYRTLDELKSALKEIKAKSSAPIGVNLIVNKSNILWKKQMHTCLDEGVDYFLTSLGSPEEVIRESKRTGAKVFCDVVDVKYARKVEELGADGVVAVNSGAGGHRGEIPATVLVPLLKMKCKIPVIAAGGVGTGSGILAMLSLGADGVSIGSPFIPTLESGVNDDYKQACLKYGAEDIVATNKISGTPCTVINTPYMKKIGTDQNLVENFLNQNRKLKKYAKMLTAYRGMKMLEKAAFSATYNTIWVAGSSIEFSEKIESVNEVAERLKREFYEAHKNLMMTLG